MTIMNTPPNIATFLALDLDAQIAAGWYDWFCSDRQLAAKTRKLVRKLKSLIPSQKIDTEMQYVFFKNNCQYVFFKNNCSLRGSLYDDFRICDSETSEVIFTIVPSRNRTAEVWGRENDFESPLVCGAWRDVVKFFRESH